MAGRGNGLTIRVHPNRRSETITIRGTGHFGKTQLSIGPLYLPQQPLTAAPDAKAYWNAILVIAQAAVLSM